MVVWIRIFRAVSRGVLALPLTPRLRFVRCIEIPSRCTFIRSHLRMVKSSCMMKSVMTVCVRRVGVMAGVSIVMPSAHIPAIVPTAIMNMSARRVTGQENAKSVAVSARHLVSPERSMVNDIPSYRRVSHSHLDYVPLSIFGPLCAQSGCRLTNGRLSDKVCSIEGGTVVSILPPCSPHRSLGILVSARHRGET